MSVDLPSPRTWTTGDTVTAAALNEDLRDSFQFFMNPPMAHVSTTSPQPSHWDRGLGVANGYGTKLIAWNIADIDTDAMWDGAQNTRLTAKTAGWYEITLHIDWQLRDGGAFNNGANRFATIQKNYNGGRMMGGATEIGCDMAYILGNNTSVPQTNHLVIHHFLSVGDYVEALVMNTSADDLQIFRTPTGGGPTTQFAHTTYFAARWIASQ